MFSILHCSILKLLEKSNNNTQHLLTFTFTKTHLPSVLARRRYGERAASTVQLRVPFEPYTPRTENTPYIFTDTPPHQIQDRITLVLCKHITTERPDTWLF